MLGEKIVVSIKTFVLLNGLAACILLSILVDLIAFCDTLGCHINLKRKL